MSMQSISVSKHRYLHIFAVVLGLIWIIATADCVQFRRIQARKLHSSLEPDLDDNFSNEDLRKLLTLLEGTSKETSPKNGDDSSKTSSALEHTEHVIMPELMRIRPQSSTSTTTTPNPPVSRFTTRRFYRRLRRKTTTTSTEAPLIPSSSSTERMDHTSVASAESPRLLQSGPSPTDLLHQLSLLNGILGALNSSAAAPTATPTPLATNNANSNNNNATPVPDILAFLTGAKNIGEASSNHETIVPPPPPPTKGQVEDPTAALALLNLFSGGNSQRQDNAASNNNNNAAAANLLGLMAQAQNAPQPSPTSAVDNNDAAAALTKLLLQGTAGASALQGNSIAQQQNQNAEASANQLNNLLGLLGTLGGAAQQQPQAGGINNLFNLGGDQMAQAQTNSLATLFGSQSQQQSQQAQAQNLLNLFGGNQGGQGLNLASLLAPQVGNSIPGLGLLSTVSSLGSSIFSTVSNLFGGSGGKPRVRGKGVDTRVGLGYRLGNVGDAQMVWEIGPQLYTDPLRNEARPYTKKRESGLPAAASHYIQPASTTAAEKEMQQIEAKRRMVQAAIQDHYRGNHFQSVYPQPTQRRRSHLNYNHFESLYPSSKSKPLPTTTTPAPSSSSFLSGLPFGDHLRGFWSGITSGVTGDEDDATSHFNFDDVRNDFSNNLIKRSSPSYTDYESRAYHPRRMEEDLDDPTHSTLTEYERMLLQYGKGIGVANTKHGVIDDEPQSSESQSQSFFSRWFKGSSSTSSNTKAQPSQSPHANSEWGMGAASNEYPTRNPSNISPRPRTKQTLRQSQPSAASPYGPDLSYNRRNDVPSRANPRRNGGGQRPQKRRSHNPFRNWFSSFKSGGGGQRARYGNHHTKGFGRRHFKRPSVSNNPQLQHFTNTNKDLMMADANDDFVESAGAESAPAPSYQQPLSYEYANEFPDVPLTPPYARRQRPSHGFNKVRASLSQRERIVEPALLYDHLEATDSVVTEADESFDNRNKVVVNPALREIEKQKVLSASKTSLNKATSAALTKAQRLSILKARHNATKLAIAAVKQRVIVKNRGNTRNNIPSTAGHDESVSESTTMLPSVISTISSIFKGTSKPKLLSKLYNATSYLPSILPRKKNQNENKIKTKLTLQNGKPAVIVPMNYDDDEDAVDDDDMETAADDVEPVVQVGHDMSFTDLQSLFGASQKNSTKRKRIRIRVKESVLNGEDTKERKDAEEDDDDNDSAKDIFVDIESGEVSVLKPVASLVSFTPKKEEASDEEETDYYEDDDGDGVPDADMNRKEHIFEAIQKQLVNNFEKMKKAQKKAEAKKRRKQELAEKGMDESMDVVTKLFDLHQTSEDGSYKPAATKKPKFVGGLSLQK